MDAKATVVSDGSQRPVAPTRLADRRAWWAGGVACVAWAVLGFEFGGQRVPFPSAPLAVAGPAPVRVVPAPTPRAAAVVPHAPPPRAPAAPEGDSGRRAATPPRVTEQTHHAPVETSPARNDAQDRQMAEIVAQLQELKTEVSAEQQAQQARDTELAQREESRRTALGALQRAEAALALGNTDIERELEEAESVLNPSANAALANVRQSLANDDLYSARQYLQQAIIAADSGSGISRTLSAGGHRHHGGR